MPPDRSSARGGLRRGQKARVQNTKARLNVPDATAPRTPPRTRRNRPLRSDSPCRDPPCREPPHRNPPRRDPPIDPPVASSPIPVRPPSPLLEAPLPNIAAKRNEAIPTASSLSGRRGRANSLKTYLFSIQVFVERELVYDDGDTLELAQFNYTLQEEKIVQKLSNWRGGVGGEVNLSRLRVVVVSARIKKMEI